MNAQRTRTFLSLALLLALADRQQGADQQRRDTKQWFVPTNRRN
jgi:hypothetical protein